MSLSRYEIVARTGGVVGGWLAAALLVARVRRRCAALRCAASVAVIHSFDQRSIDNMNSHNHTTTTYAHGAAAPHDTASIANGHAAAPAAPAAAADGDGSDGDGDGDAFIRSHLADVMASTSESYQFKMRLFNEIMKRKQVWTETERSSDSSAWQPPRAQRTPPPVRHSSDSTAAHINLHQCFLSVCPLPRLIFA